MVLIVGHKNFLGPRLKIKVLWRALMLFFALRDRYPKFTELGIPRYELDRAEIGDRRCDGIIHHAASG